jgi:hypothetical protein
MKQLKRHVSFCHYGHHLLATICEMLGGVEGRLLLDIGFTGQLQLLSNEQKLDYVWHGPI